MQYSGRRYLSQFFYPLSYLLILILFYPAFAFSDEKGQKEFLLSKKHVQKLRRIAEITAAEITKRGIKSVEVKDFTDSSGKPSAAGKEVSREFKRQLTSVSNKYFNVTNNNPGAIITGTVIPFTEKKKWQLKIKVASSHTGKVVASYIGILQDI